MTGSDDLSPEEELHKLCLRAVKSFELLWYRHVEGIVDDVGNLMRSEECIVSARQLAYA